MGKGFQSTSVELIQTAEGGQYHIGLAPGEVAPFIMLCGDVERVDKVAVLLDDPGRKFTSREYITVTGKYKNVPVSVMSTGIGTDNTEIALVELAQIVKNPTLIRVGTSSGLRTDTKIGEMAISSGSVRLEATSTYFVPEGYPSFANHEVVLALLEAASQTGRGFHLGLTASACGFYGAQGRNTPYFKSRFPKITEELENLGVMNMEMETSTLFSLSTLAGFRSGAVCAMIGNRHSDLFIESEEKIKLERDCIKTALEAFVILSKMDVLKGENKYWLPRMGIK